jgi:hypothetical protein
VIKFFVGRGYMVYATEDDTTLTSRRISMDALRQVGWGTTHNEEGALPEGGLASLVGGGADRHEEL